jgi:LEA14-like dessication related protein
LFTFDFGKIRKMMRTYLFLALLGTLFGACTRPQEPIFKRLAELKATKVSTREITISGQAVYHNPNALGLTLTATDIEVFIEDLPVAHIQQDLAIEVPAQAEFRVPLTFRAKPQDIYQNDRNGLIGGAINALLNKQVEVHYQGSITVSMAGINYEAPIDYREEVALR